ncbi:manganese transporter, partial [Paraburkholderia sp. BR10872]
LLLLCNDKAVLGPWVNSKRLNVFTGAVIAVLVVLSIILTAATVFPDISGAAIVKILVGGCGIAVAVYAAVELSRKSRGANGTQDALPLNKPALKELRNTWRMAPLEDLPAPQHLTLSTRVWMGVLRTYLVVAVGLVIVKVVQMAIH